jgi:hypothetical protein
MMTAKIGSAASAKVIARITGPEGVNLGLAALMQASPAPAGLLDATQVRSQNVTDDIAERSGTTQYPAVSVYCEKVSNTMAEKFQTFSGTAQMAIELRHSQDRLDGLQDSLEVYADAVMQMLNRNRGDWGDGMYYAGAYQTAFSAVKHGGKNFVQTAKVTFEIGVSRN